MAKFVKSQKTAEDVVEPIDRRFESCRKRHVRAPPPNEVMNCLGEWESFVHSDTPEVPPLIKAGLIHVQFETIHPFLDGNGRLGRLLITLFLCATGVLREPLLYLSLYFKSRRANYYRLLQEVREYNNRALWAGHSSNKMSRSPSRSVAVNADELPFRPRGTRYNMDDRETPLHNCFYCRTDRWTAGNSQDQACARHLGRHDAPSELHPKPQGIQHGRISRSPADRVANLVQFEARGGPGTQRR
ncbi:Adenosine monophosphate-protein transferase SoFic [Ensifer adhaerens]|nr:Adenosine monophosphate-protein transferase SoFic [Ensifer adhaerens]